MGQEYHLLDEQAQEAALQLLENYWITRDEKPELYHMVRDREKMLKNFFAEKLGYQLIIHRFFVKLVKVPGEPEVWMGIEEFSSQKDYVLLCCLLAFLEEKGAEEQFLLSELVEAIQAVYPGEDGVDWTQYEDRKALVRVLKFSREMSLITAIEGEEAVFSQSLEGEVLYENTPQSRYFLRVFARELATYENYDEILASEWLGDEEHRGLRRRHRIYRKLFLTPGVMPVSGDDPDFLYLRNYRNTIKQDLEEDFPAYFELYSDLAVMKINERRQVFTLFPDNKNISEIVLQFAGLVRRRLAEEQLKVDLLGRIGLTRFDLETLVRDCREEYGHGWTKLYREMEFGPLVAELMQHMVEWNMAWVDREMGLIYLLPLLSRSVGTYPDDFSKEEDLDEE